MASTIMQCCCGGGSGGDGKIPIEDIQVFTVGFSFYHYSSYGYWNNINSFPAVIVTGMGTGDTYTAEGHAVILEQCAPSSVGDLGVSMGVYIYDSRYVGKTLLISATMSGYLGEAGVPCYCAEYQYIPECDTSIYSPSCIRAYQSCTSQYPGAQYIRAVQDYGDSFWSSKCYCNNIRTVGGGCSICPGDGREEYSLTSVMPRTIYYTGGGISENCGRMVIPYESIAQNCGECYANWAVSVSLQE